MKTVCIIMQGVLSYEEKLQRAREELAIRAWEAWGTRNRVAFWQSRAKELEARLQIYEGEKEGDEPKGGGTNDSSEDVVRHVSAARTGSDGGVQVHVSVMPDETAGS